MHIKKLFITALLLGSTILASADNFSLEQKQSAYETFIAQKLQSEDPSAVFNAATLSANNPNLSTIVEKQLTPLLKDTDNILLLDYVINYCFQQSQLDFCQLDKLIKQAAALSPSNAKFNLYLVHYYMLQHDKDKALQALSRGATKAYYDSLYASYIDSNYQFLAEFSSDKNTNLILAIGSAAANGLPALTSLSKLCSAKRNPHLTETEKSDCIQFLTMMGETGQTNLSKQLAYALLVDLLEGEEKSVIQNTLEELKQLTKDSAELNFILFATPDLFVQRLKTLGEVGTFKRYLEDNKKGD